MLKRISRLFRGISWRHYQRPFSNEHVMRRCINGTWQYRPETPEEIETRGELAVW